MFFYFLICVYACRGAVCRYEGGLARAERCQRVSSFATCRPLFVASDHRMFPRFAALMSLTRPAGVFEGLRPRFPQTWDGAFAYRGRFHVVGVSCPGLLHRLSAALRLNGGPISSCYGQCCLTRLILWGVGAVSGPRRACMVMGESCSGDAKGATGGSIGGIFWAAGSGFEAGCFHIYFRSFVFICGFNVG